MKNERRSGGVNPGDSVGAIPGDENRLAFRNPCFELSPPCHLGGGEVAGVDPQTVVTVEHWHVTDVQTAQKPAENTAQRADTRCAVVSR